MTYAERLERAMKHADIPSAKALAAVIVLDKKDRGAKELPSGASRRSIDGYLKGTRHPKRDFDEAVARITGVRLSWLANEDGPMTGGASAMVWREQEVLAFNISFKLWQGTEATIQPVRDLSLLLQDTETPALAAFLDFWPRYTRAVEGASARPRLTHAKALVKLLEAPLAARGMRKVDEMTPQQRGDYVMAMLQAIKLALP